MNYANVILLLQKGFTVTEIARFYGVSVEEVLKCRDGVETDLRDRKACQYA